MSLDNIGAMQARRHIASLADLTVHEGEVEHRIERGAIGVARKFTKMRFDRKAGDSLDELLARLSECDEVGHRNALELMALCEIHDLLTNHHRAVVIGEFADRGDRR